MMEIQHHSPPNGMLANREWKRVSVGSELNHLESRISGLAPAEIVSQEIIDSQSYRGECITSRLASATTALQRSDGIERDIVN